MPDKQLKKDLPDKKVKTYAKVFGNPTKKSIGLKVDTFLFYKLAKQSSDVMPAINEIQKNFGLSGWFLENEKMEKIDIKDEGYLEISYILNSIKISDLFFRDVLRHLIISGDCFIHKVLNKQGDKVVGLQVIDSRTISIIADKQGSVHYYIQHGLSDYSSIVFEENEIIHIKQDDNFENDLFGFSKLTPVLRYISSEKEIAETVEAFYKNNAIPGAWFILENDLSEEEKEIALDMMKSQFQGSHNKGKGGIFDGVKDIKLLNYNAKEYEQLETQKYITEKVCSALDVPKYLLGYNENVQYNNSQGMLQNFYLTTCRAYENLVAEFFNRYLLPELSLKKLNLDYQDLKFGFYKSNFNENEDKKIYLQEKQNGCITTRQYLKNTGQQAPKEYEKNPAIDKLFISNGKSVMAIDDIGKIENEKNV